MKTFYVIRQEAEYIVEGETPALALMNFSEHGDRCDALVMHSRSGASCTGERIEAEDLRAALIAHKRKRDALLS